MFGGAKQVTQASTRTGAIFTDEFGREWHAIVGNSGANVGYPISISPYRWKAPLYPPNQYIRVTDVASRRIKVDTAAWKQDRERASREWVARLHKTASEMFATGALAAIERRDPNLFYRMGDPPPSIAQIEAYEQGHPWVLGKDPRKPKSLEAIFPEAPKLEHGKFLTWEEEQAQAGGDETDEPAEFPKKRADGGYDTSDGYTYTGKGALARAREHQASLKVGV